MMFMTAKVDKKIIVIGLAVAAVLLAALITLLSGRGETAATAAPGLTTNDGRVAFLQNFGWEVGTTPTESTQVRIPKETDDVFERYNALQKSQGYDLSKYAGKSVMRYVYRVKNFPGATEPVYATLLIYKGQVIGGDVTDTSPKGAVRGFQMPKIQESQPSESSQPYESGQPSPESQATQPPQA